MENQKYFYKIELISGNKYFYTGDKRKEHKTPGINETSIIPTAVTSGRVCVVDISNGGLSTLPDDRGIKIYLKTDPTVSKIIDAPGYISSLYTKDVPLYPRYQIYENGAYIGNADKKDAIVSILYARYDSEMEQAVAEGIVISGTTIPLTVNTQLNLLGGNSKKDKITYPKKVAKGISLSKVEFEAFYDATVTFKEDLIEEKFIKQEALEDKTIDELISLL